MIVGRMDRQMSRLLILQAAEQGNASVVAALLDKGHHIDTADEDGVNALHSAAANGNDSVVCLLLSRGASLEARTIYGWTALMLASYYGHLMVCCILLQHKSDIYAQNELGHTALDCAARSGHSQIINWLIEADTQQQVLGETVKLCLNSPLMNAAQHGHELALKLLLEKGADVNYRDGLTGWTPLMLAALNGHVTAAQILVASGADTNVLNVIDHTALNIAAVRQKTEVQDFLDERTATRPQIKGQKCIRPSIIEAARNGDVILARELLDLGEGDKNATDEDGATPLMYAAMGGHLSVVQLLIDRGADIDRQDQVSGWTALMQATYYRFKAVAKLLIKSGADVNIRDKNSCTAFDMASVMGDTEIFRLLASASNMQLPSTRKEYYLHFTKGSKGRFSGSERDLSGYNRELFKDDGGQNWWSKLSRRFRNLNVGRTFKAQSSSKIHVLSKSYDNLNEEESSDSQFSEISSSNDSGVTLRSLTSVISESALKRAGHIRPHSMALVSHVTKLPDDVITPVIPPPLPSPAFELPMIHRPQHSNDLQTPTTPTGPSSVSAYPTDRPLISPTLKKITNFTGSPESSYSTASFHSSNSNNSGSRTIKATSPAAESVFSPWPSSPLWHKPGKANFSRSPTPTSVHSAPAWTSSMQKQSSFPSLQSHSDSSNSTLTSHTHRRYSYNNTFDFSEADDPENILKKLSLEKYQPIFEEQEVDMEAFLTLTDRDLRELGVETVGERQQILTTITELNSGKDRQRQHQHETMSSYHSSKSHHGTCTSGYSSVSPSASTNMPHWLLKQPP